MSRIRQCIMPNGRPKMAFASEQGARNYKNMARLKGLHAYFCLVCEHYHLGHKRPKLK